MNVFFVVTARMPAVAGSAISESPVAARDQQRMTGLAEEFAHALAAITSAGVRSNRGDKPGSTDSGGRTTRNNPTGNFRAGYAGAPDTLLLARGGSCPGARAGSAPCLGIYIKRSGVTP